MREKPKDFSSTCPQQDAKCYKSIFKFCKIFIKQWFLKQTTTAELITGWGCYHTEAGTVIFNETMLSGFYIQESWIIYYDNVVTCWH